jgi:TPP-dependent pyruvate/acetoin dehydrogenase alpha subunit
MAVYETVQAAVGRARAGEGATLVEAKTFRLSGHAFRGPRPEERDPELLESWRQRDPIGRTRQHLLGSGILDHARDADLTADVAREIEDAVKFAEASPWPDVESALVGLFSETGADG